MDRQINQQEIFKQAKALQASFQDEMGGIEQKQKDLFERAVKELEQRKIAYIKEQIWKPNT